MKKIIIIAALALAALVLFLVLPKPPEKPVARPTVISLSSVPPLELQSTQTLVLAHGDFEAEFNSLFKPVVEHWCKIFAEHLRFSPESITAAKMFGSQHPPENTNFHYYLFMVDGVTFGMRKNSGVVAVDYLNDGRRTAQMGALPDRPEPTILKPVVSREEVIRILYELSGKTYYPYEVRVRPTGLFGALNGGTSFDIGGSSQDCMTWHYNLIFDPEGMLIYYQDVLHPLAVQ